MEYEIKVLEMPDQPTLFLHTTTSVENLPEFFKKAYVAIMSYLETLGETPAGMPFAAYFNFDMNALELEAGFPVFKPMIGRGEIKAGIIPGGKFISTLHKGDYGDAEFAYNALVMWATEHNEEPADISYEYYLNDPSESPDIVPITEIRLPLKQK